MGHVIVAITDEVEKDWSTALNLFHLVVPLGKPYAVD